MFVTNEVSPETGLEPGYDAEQWGPWKSHGLLLQTAIEDLGWSENATVLLRLFKEFGRAKDGYLTEAEFLKIFETVPIFDENQKPDTSLYKPLFTLFDRNQDGLLSESDFVAGILATSPSTPHALDKPCGQLRMQMIFLFYDSDRDGKLELPELSLLVEHLKQIKSKMITEK